MTIQEVDVALEEDFNETMLQLLRDLPMQDIYQVLGATWSSKSDCTMCYILREHQSRPVAGLPQEHSSILLNVFG